jgi:hypothetical protein
MGAMSIAQETRRRSPRFQIPQPIAGNFLAAADAKLLNISFGGALIEHTGWTRLGVRSFLVLPLEGRKVPLSCRVVRSQVSRTIPRGDGTRDLIYLSGVEFLHTGTDASMALQALIFSLNCQPTDSSRQRSHPDSSSAYQPSNTRLSPAPLVRCK